MAQLLRQRLPLASIPSFTFSLSVQSCIRRNPPVLFEFTQRRYNSNVSHSLAQREQNKANMRRVLVVGGGPAGSVTAFWLAKAGFEVVVVERSTVEPYGQGIDVTDEAVDVVKRMGLLEQIKSSTTGESGFTMVDDAGKDIASLGTNSLDDGKGGIGSPTQEIEASHCPFFEKAICHLTIKQIMRGKLVNILAQAAKDQGAEFRYG
jgi:2-polyprenyl-6-methoxyphenol hydroxylase-like FAD-dependent oxidoreductase